MNLMDMEELFHQMPGKKYYDTIIGYPIVAKLKKNIFGKAVDFGGHELTIEKDKKWKKD